MKLDHVDCLLQGTRLLGLHARGYSQGDVGHVKGVQQAWHGGEFRRRCDKGEVKEEWQGGTEPCGVPRLPRGIEPDLRMSSVISAVRSVRNELMQLNKRSPGLMKESLVRMASRETLSKAVVRWSPRMAFVPIL